MLKYLRYIIGLINSERRKQKKLSNKTDSIKENLAVKQIFTVELKEVIMIPLFLDQYEYEILYIAIKYAAKYMDEPYYEPLEYEKIKNNIAENIIQYYKKEKEDNLPF